MEGGGGGGSQNPEGDPDDTKPKNTCYSSQLNMQ